MVAYAVFGTMIVLPALAFVVAFVATAVVSYQAGDGLVQALGVALGVVVLLAMSLLWTLPALVVLVIYGVIKGLVRLSERWKDAKPS